MQTIKSLFQNTFFSIFSNLLNRVGNTLLFILIIQRVSVEAGGVYDLGISYFLIASRLALFGLGQIIARDVAANKDEIDKYASNFLAVRIVFSIIIIVISINLIWLTDYSEATKLAIIVLLLSVIPENINELCRGIYVAFEDVHLESIGTFLNATIRLVLGIYFVYIGKELVAISLVILIGHLGAMVINLSIIHFKYVHAWQKPDVQFLKAIFPVATPFIIIGSFYILDNRVDKILLSFLADEKDIGLYAAATTVIFALTMIPESYRTAVLPIMSRYQKTNIPLLRKTYIHSYKFLTLMSLPLLVGTILVSEDLIKILYRQDLPAAVPALQILALSLVFIFINALNTRLLLVYNYHKMTAVIYIVAFLVNIILIVWLIPQLGAVGAAIGTSVSLAIRFILLSIIARRFMPSNQASTYMLRAIIAVLVMGFVVWQLTFLGFWMQILAGIIVYSIMLFVTGAISKEERQTLSNLGKQTVTRYYLRQN